jgi:hypothetical protein
MSVSPDAPPPAPATTKSPSAPSVPGASTIDGMKALQDAQRKLEESLAKVESQIRDHEASYLEDTAHGNIIRGWDGYADLRGKKDALLKKVRPYADNEKLFSMSSVPPTSKSFGGGSSTLTEQGGDDGENAETADEPKRSKKKAAVAAGTSAGSEASAGRKAPGKTPSVKKTKKRKLLDEDFEELDDAT